MYDNQNIPCPDIKCYWTGVCHFSGTGYGSSSNTGGNNLPFGTRGSRWGGMMIGSAAPDMTKKDP